MAKKKKKPEGESPRSPRRPKSSPRPKRAKRGAAQGPTGAAINALMKQLLGETDDPIRARAQELLHRAFESDDPAEVVELARQALEVWPDCADAYVLLAEEARDPQQAADPYAMGIEAAT